MLFLLSPPRFGSRDAPDASSIHARGKVEGVAQSWVIGRREVDERQKAIFFRFRRDWDTRRWRSRVKMFFQGENISYTHIADAVLYIYRWPWIDLEETRMDDGTRIIWKKKNMMIIDHSCDWLIVWHWWRIDWKIICC